MRKPTLPFIVFTAVIVAALLLAACGSAATPVVTEAPVEQEAVEQDEHEEGEMHDDEHEEEMDEHMEDAGEHMDEHSPDEHMAGAHDVPDEAAAVENPVEATDESVSAGQALYATNCAVCHGDTGEGDGPTASALDPAPADLHEDHVQDLTDGALFYIISHGRPESAMPAWEGTLEEQERWDVVNFLRTFRDS